MDFFEELVFNDNSKIGEECWGQFANFIDSMGAFFEKKDSTKHIVYSIKEKLKDTDIYSVVMELINDNCFKDAVKNYFEELFPLNAIQKQFSKNHIEAMALFQKANDYMRQNNFERSLNFFSKAICFAEHESSDNLLASLYNKRSFVFFQLKLYYDCILDLEQLILINQDDSVLSDIYLRMAKAAINVKKWDNVTMPKKIFNKCSDFKSKLKCPDEIKKWEHLIAQLSSIIEKLIGQSNSIMKNESEELDLFEINHEIHGASSKVKLAMFDDKKNRGFKAIDEIKEGDLVFVEQPFVLHYFCDTNKFHCANCLRRLCQPMSMECFLEQEEHYTELTLSDYELNVIYNSFVPCYTCNEFKFCNQQCLDEAYNRYHKKECHKWMFALENQIGIAYLIARLVSGSLDTCILEMLPKLDISTYGLKAISQNYNDTIKLPHNAVYESVLKLMNHGDQHDNKSNVCFILTAFFLNVCFDKMEIFPKFLQLPNEMTLIVLLIYHLQQLSTNVINIFEQNLMEDDLSNSRETPVAVGLYLTLSFLNHSCDPNLIPIYAGSKIILKAKRSIAAGEELCFSYGPTYFNMNYSQRQKWLLEQYFFRCQCKSCLIKQQNFNKAFLCNVCYGPAFIEHDAKIDNLNGETENGKKMLLNCRNGHCTEDIETIKDKIKTAQKFVEEGHYFLRINLKTCDDVSDDEKIDYVAALTSLYKADVILTETLYCLNDIWLKLRNDMINCYLKMGHYDRAAIYCKHLINSYNKHGDNQANIMRSIKEKIRLIKIHWLQVEEQEELINNNKSELTVLSTAKSQIKTLHRDIGKIAKECLQFYELMSPNDIDFIQIQLERSEKFEKEKNLKEN